MAPPATNQTTVSRLDHGGLQGAACVFVRADQVPINFRRISAAVERGNSPYFVAAQYFEFYKIIR